MNYRKIYFKIINKALRKEYTGQRWKGDGNYYEKHHIKPRSLRGTDKNNNLVLLTAKEHYICHWLLVKSYDKDTIERKKMLKAWFMMACVGDTGRPIISMKDYEKYKTEFAKYMSEKSQNINNSMYGKHWYTDLRTGMSKPFNINPGKFWVMGKNWFNNEGKNLWSIKEKTRLIWRKKHLCKTNTMALDERRIKSKKRAQEYWNQFHSGTYLNLSDYCRKENIEIHALVQLLKRHILLYRKMINRKNNGAGFKPDIKLVNIYE